MIKRIAVFFENIAWNIRCRYALRIHGSYGLAGTVGKMPFMFIVKYLRKYGATIGENAIIEPGIIIHRPANGLPFKNLIFGNDIYIGHYCLFDLTGMIKIEDEVKLGAGCQLWTHTGYFNNNGGGNKIYREKTGKIELGRRTICYSGVLISQGVVLGQDCRVGAGSVILESASAGSFLAGSPARRVENNPAV